MKTTAFIILFSVSLFSATFASGAFTADLSRGDVSLRISSTPDKITPAEDVMLTLTVEAPSTFSVKLPDLQDRFTGFSTAEDFATDPVSVNGRTRQVYRWRLVPRPGAERYRLAPFAVDVLDNGSTPPSSASFATTPVVFPAEGGRPSVTGDVEVTPEAVYIRPTAKTVTLWGLAVLAGLALLAGAIYGLTRLSRTVRELHLSPIDRALAELNRLLGRNLPKRGLYKDFYIELTMVVRRYIERVHGIRAPEQTTEEFLEAASQGNSFSSDVLLSLRGFLESADLVKFAGQEASQDMADGAVEKARGFLRSVAASSATDGVDSRLSATGADDRRLRTGKESL